MKDLDTQADKYLKKFNKDNCKVLHLGGNDPRLGSDWLEGKFAENLVILVDKKLNKSPQGALAVTKAHHILDCSSKL